jgi:hypothetical protein
MMNQKGKLSTQSAKENMLTHPVFYETQQQSRPRHRPALPCPSPAFFRLPPAFRSTTLLILRRSMSRIHTSTISCPTPNALKDLLPLILQPPPSLIQDLVGIRKFLLIRGLASFGLGDQSVELHRREREGPEKIRSDGINWERKAGSV